MHPTAASVQTGTPWRPLAGCPNKATCWPSAFLCQMAGFTLPRSATVHTKWPAWASCRACCKLCRPRSETCCASSPPARWPPKPASSRRQLCRQDNCMAWALGLLGLLGAESVCAVPCSSQFLGLCCCLQEGSQGGGGGTDSVAEGTAAEAEAEQPSVSKHSDSATAGTAGAAPDAAQLVAGGVWVAMSELLDKAEKQGEGRLSAALCACLACSGGAGGFGVWRVPDALPSAAAALCRRRACCAAAALPTGLCAPAHRQLAHGALYCASRILCGQRRLAGGGGVNCQGLPGAACRCQQGCVMGGLPGKL